MKFFALRTLTLLIGVTIAAMVYLSLKMHSRDTPNSKNPTLQIGFQNALKRFLNSNASYAYSHPPMKRKSIANKSLQNVSSNPYLLKKTLPYHNMTSMPDEFRLWRDTATQMCGGLMTGYNYNFLYTSNMILNKKFCKSSRLGGESLESVIMQDEDEEYYKFEMGCFKTKCSSRPHYVFNDENHLNDWMMSLSTENFGGSEVVEDMVVKDFTIAVTRYEYANIYHTMTDWYNAFLVKEFFNRTSFDTNILLIDAHPVGNLDGVWTNLFNSTIRLSSLPNRTKFEKLAWGIIGYKSPMGISITQKKLPLFEEFRSFMLDSFEINENNFPGHGCNMFNILFIWRHDYVAHPRNPKGTIQRKIANEMELINYLKQKLPKANFKISGSQIDIFDMKKQLEIVSKADILIGMHGAGLTHTIFLKKGSALIELTPDYMFGHEHFAAIAKWRDIVYNTWTNNDPLRELPNKFTIIPPSIALTLIKKSIRELCTPPQFLALFPTSVNNTQSV